MHPSRLTKGAAAAAGHRLLNPVQATTAMPRTQGAPACDHGWVPRSRWHRWSTEGNPLKFDQPRPVSGAKALRLPSAPCRPERSAKAASASLSLPLIEGICRHEATPPAKEIPEYRLRRSRLRSGIDEGCALPRRLDTPRHHLDLRLALALQPFKIDREKYPILAVVLRGYYRDSMGRKGVNDRGTLERPHRRRRSRGPPPLGCQLETSRDPLRLYRQIVRWLATVRLIWNGSATAPSPSDASCSGREKKIASLSSALY